HSARGAGLRAVLGRGADNPDAQGRRAGGAEWQDLAGGVAAAAALLRVGAGGVHVPRRAVRRVMRPLDVHVTSLETSTALSAYYVKNFIDPLEVVRILNEAG